MSGLMIRSPRRRGIAARCAGTVLLLASACGTTQEASRSAPHEAIGQPGKPVVRAERMMVVSAHPAATEAGLAALAAGGSAADAAVAVQLVLNLVEPQYSGIGGGGFVLHWDAKAHQLTAFDGRETAPAAAGPGYFLGPDGLPMVPKEARAGGRSVGVPGTLALIELVHELHGRRPWAELAAPAIRLAEAGLAISPQLGDAIANAAPELRLFPAAAGYFLHADGAPKAAGTVLRNPAFAATLRQVAAEGAAALYTGEIGRDLVRAVREAPVNPGLMTEADLAGYRVRLREPVCRPYRVYLVCGMGPPSSGGVAVAQILGLLEHFDLAGLGPTVDGAHVLLEASKLAFADRGLYLADPDFVSVPVSGLLDPGYLAARARLIRRDTAIPKAVPGAPPGHGAVAFAADTAAAHHGTSHLVVADPEGNVVSMTTTLHDGFGSRLMIDGFLLNDELTTFSFRPSLDGRPVANRVEGGKRPRSSMAPTIVFDREQRPVVAIGAPGADRIIGYVAQALVAMLDWGMSPQQALAMGHVLNRNGPTELEAGTPVAGWAEPLAARGHEVRVKEMRSGLHAVGWQRDGAMLSGVDPRRDGAVLGR